MERFGVGAVTVDGGTDLHRGAVEHVDILAMLDLAKNLLQPGIELFPIPQERRNLAGLPRELGREQVVQYGALRGNGAPEIEWHWVSPTR